MPEFWQKSDLSLLTVIGAMRIRLQIVCYRVLSKLKTRYSVTCTVFYSQNVYGFTVYGNFIKGRKSTAFIVRVFKNLTK
jgi:hypothetical protein